MGRSILAIGMWSVHVCEGGGGGGGKRGDWSEERALETFQ